MSFKAVRFMKNNLNEVEQFLGAKVSEIKIHLGPNFATLKFKQIGTVSEIVVNEGDYIVETNHVIPNIIPETGYLIVCRAEVIKEHFGAFG